MGDRAKIGGGWCALSVGVAVCLFIIIIKTTCYGATQPVLSSALNSNGQARHNGRHRYSCQADSAISNMQNKNTDNPVKTGR